MVAKAAMDELAKRNAGDERDKTSTMIIVSKRNYVSHKNPSSIFFWSLKPLLLQPTSSVSSPIAIPKAEEEIASVTSKDDRKFSLRRIKRVRGHYDAFSALLQKR